MADQALFIFIVTISGAVSGSFFAWFGKELIDSRQFRLRSACDVCRRRLAWWEMIPIISYLGLGGKCRSCSSAIVVADWAMELIGAVLLGLGAWRFGISRDFLWWALFALSTMLVFYVDLRWMIVPRTFSIIVALIVLMAQWSTPWLPIVILTGLLGAIFYFFLYAMSRGRWVGNGDVGLGFIIGIAAGTPSHLGITLLLAHLVGAAVAVIMLKTRLKKWGDALPLGAFLMPASWLTVLYYGWIH